MISEMTQKVIKDVFPDLKIHDYAENEAYVEMQAIYPDKLKELIEKTAHWSGCDWAIRGNDSESISIHFRHIAFYNSPKS